ncbi:MAG: hypothetical protein R6X18_18095, partial [Chloroflexota bacterium]
VPTPETVVTTEPVPTLEPSPMPVNTHVPATATVPPEPTATVATGDMPGEVPATLDEFIAVMQAAVATQDWATLESLMADPFTIGYWMSEGVTSSAVEVIEQMENNFLSGNAIVVWADPDLDLAPMLMGQPPATMLGPDKNVVAALLSYGWGPDGNGEAIQLITEQPDGALQWELMLYSSFGFIGLPTDVPAVVITADEATFYSGPGTTYETVAMVAGGFSYPVIGTSSDGQWWRLECYDDANARIPSCWVSTDPAISQPTTLP